MAIDRKYGANTIRGIPDGEPVFVIRAQDASAVDAVLAYAELARRGGASAELVTQAENAAEWLARWQVDNIERVKVPD